MSKSFDMHFPPSGTTELRQEINNAVAEFIANGGRITHCPRGMSSFAAKFEEQKAAYRAGNFKGTAPERRAARKAVILEDTAMRLAECASAAQLREWMQSQTTKYTWLAWSQKHNAAAEACRRVGWMGKKQG